MTPQVGFVVTPFLPEHQPALGVSSLAAVLGDAGIDATILYLNLDYRARYGADVAARIVDSLPGELLLGDMIFTRALWGEEGIGWHDYRDRLHAYFAAPHARVRLGNVDEILDAAYPLYRDAPAIVEEWADTVLAHDFGVVGFTTTFQQNVASLALAKALRRRRPSSALKLLLGGANCEADMGRTLAANFAFLDQVVSGEAERDIVGLVRHALDSLGQDGIAGGARFVTGTPVVDLDALPYPRFDDFIAAVQAHDPAQDYNLCAESSRGCWWGAKSHCVFCGLNGGTMAYRSKRPQRVLDELRTLSARYGSRHFMMADNIVDMKYLKTLVPDLAARGGDFRLFYETKANLKKDQVELLAAGGVAELQPGIESLSSATLKLMGKGTTLLQNLQLLKWCEELGVDLAWNILAGFPGEDPAEYDATARLIPLLVHLPAPTGGGRIRIDRFSPYWRDPDRYGIANLRAYWSYHAVYAPLPAGERANLAYFFEFDYPEGQRPDDYLGPLWQALAQWRTRHAAKATLEIIASDAGAIVRDTRGGSDVAEVAIDSLEAAVLRRLDSAASATALREIVPDDRLDAMLARLIARGWVVRDNDLLFSLVLDRRERSRVARRRVYEQLSSFGLSDLVEPDPASAPALT